MAIAIRGEAKIAYLAKVYGLMGVSLLFSLISAFETARSGILTRVFNNMGATLLFGIALLIIEFLAINYVIKLVVDNPSMAVMVLFAFSIINGFDMSCIFMIVPFLMVVDAFSVAILTFAVMSFIGLTVDKELNWKKWLTGMVIALAVSTLLETVLINSAVYLAISIAGVIIFSLYTVYDSQKISELGMKSLFSDSAVVIGAIDFYIDFIALFEEILAIFMALSNMNNDDN